MKRLVPVVLVLLAGCGQPTNPELLGIKVGDQITVGYQSADAENSWVIGKVSRVSGDWVKVDPWGWQNLRQAQRVLTPWSGGR
jgi:hypothetical protein